MLQHVRAGAHYGHIAQQDVDELRQFVDACFAHEIAQTGFARVVLGGLHFVAVFVDTHGAELVAPELLAFLAAALLLEEDRAG